MRANRNYGRTKAIKKPIVPWDFQGKQRDRGTEEKETSRKLVAGGDKRVRWRCVPTVSSAPFKWRASSRIKSGTTLPPVCLARLAAASRPGWSDARKSPYPVNHTRLALPGEAEVEAAAKVVRRRAASFVALRDRGPNKAVAGWLRATAARTRAERMIADARRLFPLGFLTEVSRLLSSTYHCR